MNVCRAAFPDREGLTAEGVNPLEGNHHPMAVFFARWAGGAARPLILRRYSAAWNARSPGQGNAAAREFAVLRALEGRDLLAPRAHAHGTDDAGDWLLLDALPGRNWWLPLGMVDFDKTLPGIVREQVRLLARLHSLDPAEIGNAISAFGLSLPVLSVSGVVEAARQRVRAAGDGDAATALDRVAALMAGLEESQPRLIHGDADITNLLVSRDGKVAGWIDWDEAALGDPSWDVAALVNSLRGDYQMHALAARAVADYGRETLRPVRAIAAWTALIAVLRWAFSAWLRDEAQRGHSLDFPAAERFIEGYSSHRAWAMEMLDEAEASGP